MDKIFEKYIDKDYKLFQEKLIPNSNILGIRAKNLSLIAKEYIKNNDYSLFDKELFYHEEKMVYMLMLSHIRDMKLVYDKLDKQIPQIDNWAICDSLNHLKRIKNNRDLFHKLIDKYKNSKNEFEVRFVLDMYLFHYMDSMYLNEIFNTLKNIHLDAYYSNMGAAWLLSECYIRYPKETYVFLKEVNLSDFVINKAISKVNDSFRVDDESKENLKLLRRK